tara:strand:+ start:956 stop:1144 length:189 start_codon:yes stop_codon:yes gene_type:complete
VGVVELLSVEAKLTDAVEDDFVEEISRLVAVSVLVPDSLATDELVTSEGLDGFDGFLDFHDG